MLAGSSSLLAVETLGFSSGTVERDVAIDVVSDHEAYLGLVEKEGDETVETEGVLFEGDSDRYPPATFQVTNQLPEPVSVALALDDETDLRFVEVDGATVDDLRLEVDSEDCEDGRLCPGDSSRVAIDFDLTADLPVAERTIETDLVIEADGESTTVDAERTLELRPGILAVIDLGPFRIVVRKIRDETRDSRDDKIVVEVVNTRTGRSADPIAVDAVSVPRLRLKLTDHPGRPAGLNASAEAAEAPVVNAASGVSADVEFPDETSGLDATESGDESAADDSDDLVVTLDPDGADDTEEISISLDDAP